MEDYGATLFGPSARAEQDKVGMGARYEEVYKSRFRGPLDADARAFIETRETAYLSSITETGWPYVQHRGGPAGFLKVTGPEQIGFADYLGNKQFITKGAVLANPRVSLILMDYPRKARLKLVGRAQVFDAAQAPELEARLRVDGAAPAERLVVIDLVAMDWNCPKYITPRFTEAEIAQMLGPRLQALSDENAALKARIAQLEGA
ncbi:pyridoxamine 5'-phosphate oxidase family protein [Roseobacteraceae bacterium S113]